MTEFNPTKSLVEVLQNVLKRLDRIDSRLIGKRPHSNDIAWAKAIVDGIRTEVKESLRITTD